MPTCRSRLMKSVVALGQMSSSLTDYDEDVNIDPPKDPPVRQTNTSSLLFLNIWGSIWKCLSLLIPTSHSNPNLYIASEQMQTLQMLDMVVFGFPA